MAKFNLPFSIYCTGCEQVYLRNTVFDKANYSYLPAILNLQEADEEEEGDEEHEEEEEGDEEHEEEESDEEHEVVQEEDANEEQGVVEEDDAEGGGGDANEEEPHGGGGEDVPKGVGFSPHFLQHIHDLEL